jgi:arylesterase / paraoxonase
LNVRRVVLIALLILILAITAGAALLWGAGELRTLAPHFAGHCTVVPMAANATDIRVDPNRHVAYLSYLDRRGTLTGKHTHGTVMLLDLTAVEPHLRAALVADPADFLPRALSLYAPPEGAQRLFVVSGARPGEYSVEVFQQTETGAFAATETIRDPLLVSPSAIFAVGPRQFYVADDAGTTATAARIAELLLPGSKSQILYFDGTKLKPVAAGLARATGLAGTADGQTLYASDAGLKQLHIYARDPASGALRSRAVVALGSAPGRINVDTEGNLWIAAHPQALTLLRHERAGSGRAPTQVLKLSPGARESERVSELYLNRGNELSAGNVAAVSNARLLVAALEERQLLLCQLPDSIR